MAEKNHNEMTLDECRTELERHFPNLNAIDPTLDAIAGCLLKGWWWSRFETPVEGVKWVAGPKGGMFSIALYDTGDEKLDRARLAVSCCRAMKGEQR